MFIRNDNTLKWKWIGWGIVITLVLALLGILFFDKPLFDLINNPACNLNVPDTSNNLCVAALVLSTIFNWKVWVCFSLISVAVFFGYKAVTNEYDFRYAFIKIKNSYVFYLFLSLFFACGFTEVLKIIIGRARPIFSDPALFNMFSTSHDFHSMPSGHTSISFAGLVMLGMLFPKIKWLTWTLAIIIGVSRVYVGAHWASDVIVGAFIGMLCADFAKALLKKINSK